MIDRSEGACIKALYDFFKNRDGHSSSDKYADANSLIQDQIRISDIVSLANETLQYSYVGLLETGDMIFLFPRSVRKVLD